MSEKIVDTISFKRNDLNQIIKNSVLLHVFGMVAIEISIILQYEYF